MESSLGELLGQKYEISVPSKDLLGEIESRADNEELSYVLRGGVRETLERWLYGKDVLDVLRIAGDDLSIEEFIGLLKPLQHRAYSISSFCSGASRLHPPDGRGRAVSGQRA